VALVLLLCVPLSLRPGPRAPRRIEGPLFDVGPICSVFGGAAYDVLENLAGLFCASRASISVQPSSVLQQRLERSFCENVRLQYFQAATSACTVRAPPVSREPSIARM